MIEVKGSKGDFAKYDDNGEIANKESDGSPNYKGNKKEDNTSKQDIEGKKDINTPQVSPKCYPSTIQVAQLIHSLVNQYLTMKEMADLCGLKNLHHFREIYVTPALADGAIERLYPEQPKHPKHPKQKYCLTEKVYTWKMSNH